MSADPLEDDIEYIVADIWGEFPKENYLRLKEEALKGVHSGDCTKECHSCVVCQYEEIQKHCKVISALIRQKVREGIKEVTADADYKTFLRAKEFLRQLQEEGNDGI